MCVIVVVVVVVQVTVKAKLCIQSFVVLSQKCGRFESFSPRPVEVNVSVPS